MTISTEKLSAFLDGELSPQDMLEVESALEKDTALQAEFVSLMQANDALTKYFDQQLSDPVPLDLAKAIEDFAPPAVANTPAAPTSRPGLSSLIAAIALVIGLVGGYFLAKGPIQPIGGTQISARGWLDDIASYHRVYATQKRHLVEVPASDAAHIETWLTASVGTQVRIPDLTARGLTFAGGRLLVAAEKPVAQLIYTDENGAVVALCSIRTSDPIEGLKIRRSGEFDMVSWGFGTANYVLIGEKDREDLAQIAQSLADEA